MNTNCLDLIICLFLNRRGEHTLCLLVFWLPSLFDHGGIKDSLRGKWECRGQNFLGFQFLIYVDSQGRLEAVLKNSAGMSSQTLFMELNLPDFFLVGQDWTWEIIGAVWVIIPHHGADTQPGKNGQSSQIIYKISLLVNTKYQLRPPGQTGTN